MDKIYNFTNENVASYQSLYDFSNAKVLSVLGSGDQYFSSLLYGAKDVELFDINSSAWDYFVLKYYGIMLLDYDEFYDYFVFKRMNNIESFKRLSQHLPYDVRNRLCDIHQKKNGLSSIITCDSGEGYGYDDGRVIPFFDKKKYYQLQAMLRERELPTFYLENFENLPSKLSKKSYDIVLASNIFYWIYLSNELKRISEFKELLERYNCHEVQAVYYNGIAEHIEDSFRRNGFDIDYVDPANNYQLYQDTVVSYRKK